MEREGKGEGREVRGRRGGGEKMRGIVIGGMVIGLLLGCNNGAIEELEKKSSFYESVANLGKGFLSIFTDLGDMVTNALGIKADTKKEDIGKYFTAIETTMKKVKERLNTLVGENGNYAKVKEKVDGFIKTIETIEEGAKKAAKGATTDKVIGNAVQNDPATSAEVDSVNFLVQGIKKIVEVVGLKEGSADANKTQDTVNKTAGKLLSGTSTDATEEVAAAASASIGAVSGADILRAIEKSGEASKKSVNQVTNAAEIAVATPASETLDKANKDALIAAGIALRAMAKDGKFAAKTGDAKYAHAVNGAAASAVNKTLSTLIIAIRNTVDGGLKTINDALAAVKQEDMSAEKTEGATK